MVTLNLLSSLLPQFQSDRRPWDEKEADHDEFDQRHATVVDDVQLVRTETEHVAMQAVDHGWGDHESRTR